MGHMIMFNTDLNENIEHYKPNRRIEYCEPSEGIEHCEPNETIEDGKHDNS